MNNCSTTPPSSRLIVLAGLSIMWTSPRLDFNCCEDEAVEKQRRNQQVRGTNEDLLQRSEAQTDSSLCVIYTWLQVNGVSVADPSHFDSPDLLFLFTSASLVSFFHFFFSTSRLSLSFHLSSLSWKKKRRNYPPPPPPLSSLSNKSLSLSSFVLSVSSSRFFSHTPTYHPWRWQALAHSSLLHSLLSAVLGDQSHDLMVLITGLPFQVRRQESL